MGSMHAESQRTCVAGHATQTPLEQSSSGSQAWSHEPQLSRLLATSTQSEPQNVRGDAQLQTLPMHVSPIGQASPQPPQFFSSLFGSTQTPPQTSDVAGQPQIPFLHCSAAVHAWSHIPQLSLLVARFAQTSPQVTLGDTHAHVPATHDWPVGQAVSQSPQCCALVFGSMHAPSHTRWFAGHGAHAPFAHTSDASHA